MEPNVTRSRPAIVTVFVRNGGELLLVRRTEDPVSASRDKPVSASERWDGLSRQLDDSTELAAQAREIVRSLVGIQNATIVRSGDPVAVTDREDASDSRRHPVLVEVDTRRISPAASIAETAWRPATAMRERTTVADLWRAYRQAAPSVETVAADTEHGSAWISARALEVLRDRAAVADDWETVVDAARELRAAHPEMAALTNRVNRAMARGAASDAAVDADVTDEQADTRFAPGTPAAVVTAAQRTLSEVVQADERAAERAATRLDTGTTVATLSRSGTVFDTLVAADPKVLIGESRPAGEGSEVAADLADAGIDVILTTDAALPWAIADETEGPSPDTVVVGADAVLPDGSIINKVGTRALGLACTRADVPFYAVAARDKVAIADRQPTTQSDPAPLTDDVDDDVRTWTPTFDRTPPECVDGIVTEDGVLAPEEVSSVVASHRQHARWDDGVDD